MSGRADRERERALIVDYAEGRITREEMIDQLVEHAVPAERDPWPLGDGYIPGTSDSINNAVAATGCSTKTTGTPSSSDPRLSQTYAPQSLAT